MDFDELQLSRATECAMRGLDQRGFAHAARAPEQSVVGGQSLREAPRVGEQEIARAVDPLKQAELDAIDLRHRRETCRRGAPDKGLGA